MATEFDLASFFGGGGDSEIEKLLTPKQREQLSMQATLAAAAQLLQAGGKSSQRIGLGQALGAAMQAGQGAYEKGTTGAINQLVLGQKLQESARLNEYQKALLGTPTTAAPAPSAAMQAMAAPVDQFGLGPSPQRAELMTQIEAKAPQSADEKRFNELMRKADVANAYNRPEDADKYLNQAYKIKPPEEFSTTPNFGISATGTPISYVLSKAGGMRLLNVQRSPEFNYTDTGAFISVRDKTTNKEIEQIPKSMTPGEKASNWISQQNLGVSQQRLGLDQATFARGATEIRETPEGFAYIPKVPGGVAMPVMGAGGQQLKGIAGGQPTEAQSNAAGFAQRMELSNSIINNLPAGSAPGAGTRTLEAIPFVGGAMARSGQSTDTQKFDQAAQDWIRAKLRKESGAAIGKDEMVQEYNTYFPQVGDTPEKLVQKAEARRVATIGMQKAAGKAYEPYTPAPAAAGAPTVPTAERRMIFRNGRFEFE